MREVTTDEALRDLSKFLRDMYCWCDHAGSYTSGSVEVKRETIKAMRRLVDAIQSGKVKLGDGYATAYVQLCHEGR